MKLFLLLAGIVLVYLGVSNKYKDAFAVFKPQ